MYFSSSRLLQMKKEENRTFIAKKMKMVLPVDTLAKQCFVANFSRLPLCYDHVPRITFLLRASFDVSC